MNTMTLAALQSSQLTDEGLDRYDPASQNYRHLERCRRVRVGPSVVVVFEDTQTLWFRMQELACVARQSSPGLVSKELDWYTRLLPTSTRVLAAIWISVPGRRIPLASDQLRKALAHGCCVLRSDAGHRVQSRFMREHVAGRLIGHVGWVEFTFSADDRRAMLYEQHSWRLEIEAEGYDFESEVFSESVIDSLTADMQ